MFSLTKKIKFNEIEEITTILNINHENASKNTINPDIYSEIDDKNRQNADKIFLEIKNLGNLND